MDPLRDLACESGDAHGCVVWLLYWSGIFFVDCHSFVLVDSLVVEGDFRDVSVVFGGGDGGWRFLVFDVLKVDCSWGFGSGEDIWDSDAWVWGG